MEPEKESALYNLGNTHFKDKKYDEASQRFFQTQKFASSKETKHRAFHNMGNVYMQKKEYQKAVEAYKNALRNNSKDDETRYNYALAKELLENEKPPEEQEKDDQKDQKDQKRTKRRIRKKIKMEIKKIKIKKILKRKEIKEMNQMIKVIQIKKVIKKDSKNLKKKISEQQTKEGPTFTTTSSEST